MRETVSTDRRRRPFWRRRRFIIGCLLAAALLVVVLYVQWRPGRDYRGRPAELLPADTAIYLDWRQFSVFLERVRSHPVFRSMLEEEALARLLESEETLRELNVERDRPLYRLLLGRVENFLHEWLGREAVLAVLPPVASGDAHSAVLFMAHTRLGFEDNLAELIAHHLPSLSLEQREYRGHRLYRYRDQRERQSFSYCRFGQWVLLSLRSGDWATLEAVVDRKLDAAAGSLADAAGYRAGAARRESSDGMRIYLSPDNLGDALWHFPSKNFQTPYTRFWLDYLEQALTDYEWLAGRLTLTDSLRLDIHGRRAGPPILPEGSRDIRRQLRRFPGETAAILAADGPGFAEFVRTLYGRMAASQAYGEKVRDFEQDFEAASNTRLGGDWIEPMAGPFGVAMTGIAMQMFEPLPLLEIWWQAESPEAAARNRQGLMALSTGGEAWVATPLGPLTVSGNEESLRLYSPDSLRMQGAALAPPGGAGPARLLDYPFFKEYFAGEDTDAIQPPAAEPVFIFHANLRQYHALLEQLHALLSRMPGQDAERDDELLALALLRHLFVVGYHQVW